VFHAKDGWYFNRNQDGSVTITSHNISDKVTGVAHVNFDANTWQSIIASVSKEGEDNYRFFLAEKFHNGGMAKCRHILGEKFAGAGHECGLFFDTHYMLDADHAFKS
jgi:hypothetical protein